jgi:hypothetical protein
MVTSDDPADLLADAERAGWPAVKVPGITLGPGAERWRKAAQFPPGPSVLAAVRARLAELIEMAEGLPL